MSWTVIEGPAQSVRKPLGSTTMTFTPNGAVSARSTRLKPSIANLAAWYEAIPGEPPDRVPPQRVCMTRPLPCSRRTGIAAFETWYAPPKLVSNWARKSSSSVVSMGETLA